MGGLAWLAVACTSGAHPATAPGATVATSPPRAAAASPSAAPVRGTDPLARFYHQSVHWSGCDNGFQCATVQVPLDYRRPAGRAIGVSVVRLPASDPAHRIGSLVVNPGGPGGSGVDYALAARQVVSAAVRARFDVVGFDPRGVDRSDPVHCGSDRLIDSYLAADPTPDTPAERTQLIEVAKRFAAACQQSSGALLAHVGTADVARDMDVIRAVLGDRRLTYLGKSYGTFLGATYAELFPTRVRAMVLDGAVDPNSSPADLNRVQALGFETDLADYLRDCVAHPACPLGSTYDAAQRELARLVAQVDRHPLPGDGRQLGPGELFLGMAAALYDPAGGWPALTYAFTEMERGSGTVMLRLADALVERDADGHYSSLVPDNNAVNCIDRPSPRDLAWYDRQAAELARVAPHFGAAVAYGSMVCAFWPVPPVGTVHPIRAAGTPTLLVVGTTRDPATPYVWAQRLAAELASARLLTFDGDGHTAYRRGSACIDGAVDAYLLRLQVPKAGLRCGG